MQEKNPLLQALNPVFLKFQTIYNLYCSSITCYVINSVFFKNHVFSEKKIY